MSYTVQYSPGELSLLDKEEAVLGGITARSVVSLLSQ